MSAPPPATAGLIKRGLKIYTRADVDAHASQDSCWITANGGKIYDVTSFLADHPGGDDLILQYAGKDVDEAMRARGPEAGGHEHSDSAWAMLDEFVVGRVENGARTINENWEATDDFHPEDSDPHADYQKSQFLDLSKPLVPQMWEANFSKNFYLEQVHQPRHLKESARLFGPWYLEIFTRTSWYMVPLVWLPITAYLFRLSVSQFQAVHGYPSGTALALTGANFVLGNIIWTLLEYGMHRFLFHLDYYLPDRPVALLLHFLLHGIHHYLPMDRLRLVMPPLLFTVLQYPFTTLAHVLFPKAMANGIISGAFAFYVLYDVMHYALHHTRLPAYVREQKAYHLAHHYKNFDLGYGVTSKFWDVVFNTELKLK